VVDVFITVDAESSMGGAWLNPRWRPVSPERAILGKIGAKCYGVPLIMDILEEHDLHGTFFTEVLARDAVGSSELSEAYLPIRRRGHDVQLHLHPVFHYYSEVGEGHLRRDELPPRMDLIGGLPFETQVDLLEKGKAIFNEMFGMAPKVFRAGVYGASTLTLDALERVGIFYDSSFNSCCLGTSCLIERQPTNTPWQHGGVWEIPVTTFETGAWGMRGLKPLEVSAVSLWEMRQVLEQAERLGQRIVVIILHSFSFLKRADVQFQRMRPDQLVIRRFKGLCRFLRRNRHRFRVKTFSDLAQTLEATDRSSVPSVGVLVPVCRKLVQAANRIYWL
jgi:hypothetical protein